MAKWHIMLPVVAPCQCSSPGGPDGVAGAHSYGGAVAGDDQADAVGAVRGLGDSVGVPVGARAGGEADISDDQARRFVGCLDLVDIDVAGEVLVGA